MGSTSDKLLVLSSKTKWFHFLDPSHISASTESFPLVQSAICISSTCPLISLAKLFRTDAI